MHANVFVANNIVANASVGIIGISAGPVNTFLIFF